MSRLSAAEHALSVRVVLVQPRNPLNILAAARAARNFGLGDIAVVDVQPRAWAEALEKDVDRETPHGPRATSRGWLGDARKYDTLIEAIGDCNWVLGTSSLDRRRVDAGAVIDLRDLSARISGAEFGVRDSGLADGPPDGASPRIPNPESRTPSPCVPPHPIPNTPPPALRRSRIAILFGSEKRGLTNEHLMHCQNVLRIPTVNSLPSMNLGQAVAVVCYELARGGVLDTPVEGAPHGPVGTVRVKSKSKLSEDSVPSAYAVLAAESEDAKDAKASKDIKSSEFSDLAEASEYSKEAANAAERQALVEQIGELVRAQSASNETSSLGIRQRNLCKLIAKLPLTHDDVRLLLGVVKDAKTANSASTERPRKPKESRLP